MITTSLEGGRTTGALTLSFSAMSCGISDSTSLGACSPSSKIQSNPATPTTSVVIALPSEHQQPIRRLPPSRSWRKRLGNIDTGMPIVVRPAQACVRASGVLIRLSDNMMTEM